MKQVVFPYGKEKIKYSFPDEVTVLESAIHDYDTNQTERELVENAMKNPIGSKPLGELAKGKDNVVIIASDHTRPVPSKQIIPLMLKEIRQANPLASITILIATGCHRGTTKEELISKFGEEIVKKEKIYIHDCDDAQMQVNIGTLPSGGSCKINKLAYEADLLIAEGFIEPHLFAGFSGGRKSVLPGISGRETVMANHCAEFIAHPNARTGILENNPVHKDMLWAAKTAKLQYIVNVVLNEEKKIIYAVAGDLEEAHHAGTEFLSKLCSVNAVSADIAITTNGGYPLDQNVYQAVKGMTAAEATVKKDGVVIMLAKSGDGTGGDFFYRQLAEEPDVQKAMNAYLRQKRHETLPDQWQAQILLRILLKASVVYVSDLPDDVVEKLHMIPAHSLEEALEKAQSLVNLQNPKIVAIPDGISVIVKAQ